MSEKICDFCGEPILNELVWSDRTGIVVHYNPCWPREHKPPEKFREVIEEWREKRGDI